MYTHSALTLDDSGMLSSIGVVELDETGRIIRSNGLWSPLNGTERYEEIYLSARHSWDRKILIVESTGPFLLSFRGLPRTEAELREICIVTREIELEREEVSA